MPRLRRITAVLVALLLAQLTLASAGVDGVASGAAEEHTGHQPSGTHVATAIVHAGAEHEADASCPDCESTPGHSSCGLPWMPGGCASMASCASSMIAVLATTVAGARTSDAAIAQLASTPAGPALTPEPPPPRA